MRKLIQLATALIYNINLGGFFTGSIYRGSLKSVCVPGLNCYSCPGAIGSCPLGALQMSFAALRNGFMYYVVGLLLLFGAFLGRLICGFLCPFGLIQELLHKIPFYKVKRKFKYLKYLKYIILAVFVILIPIIYVFSSGYAEPAFCKYICPAGTLEAGIPLTSANPRLLENTGFLFALKIGLLIITLIASLLIFRPFCKFICPLGAIYSLFNKIALYRYTLDKGSCTGCNSCTKACKMDIDDVKNNVNSPECIRCGMCKKNCPTGAIKTVFVKTLKSKTSVKN